MLVEVEKVTKSYLQGEAVIQALRPVSLQVEEGKTLAVIGPSGSGKTTLLSLLAGLEQASGGKIAIQGTVVSKMSEQELTAFRARHVGIVFQQFHLMPHLTALENVCLPLEILGEKNIRERATEQLERVGLGERLHHRPAQLSGGESQRVAIARALIHKPTLLLADEPSGNLDVETGAKVMDLLFALVKNEQKTMILVTHDDRLAQRCDQQLRLGPAAI